MPAGTALREEAALAEKTGELLRLILTAVLNMDFFVVLIKGTQ